MPQHKMLPYQQPSTLPQLAGLSIGLDTALKRRHSRFWQGFRNKILLRPQLQQRLPAQRVRL